MSIFLYHIKFFMTKNEFNICISVSQDDTQIPVYIRSFQLDILSSVSQFKVVYNEIYEYLNNTNILISKEDLVFLHKKVVQYNLPLPKLISIKLDDKKMNIQDFNNKLTTKEILFLIFVDGKEVNDKCIRIWEEENHLNTDYIISALLDSHYITKDNYRYNLSKAKRPLLLSVVDYYHLDIRGDNKDLINKIRTDLTDNQIKEHFCGTHYTLTERGTEVAKANLRLDDFNKSSYHFVDNMRNEEFHLISIKKPDYNFQAISRLLLPNANKVLVKYVNIEELINQPTSIEIQTNPSTFNKNDTCDSGLKVDEINQNTNRSDFTISESTDMKANQIYSEDKSSLAIAPNPVQVVELTCNKEVSQKSHPNMNNNELMINNHIKCNPTKSNPSDLINQLCDHSKSDEDTKKVEEVNNRSNHQNKDHLGSTDNFIKSIKEKNEIEKENSLIDLFGHSTRAQDNPNQTSVNNKETVHPMNETNEQIDQVHMNERVESKKSAFQKKMTTLFDEYRNSELTQMIDEIMHKDPIQKEYTWVGQNSFLSKKNAPNFLSPEINDRVKMSFRNVSNEKLKPQAEKKISYSTIQPLSESIKLLDTKNTSVESTDIKGEEYIKTIITSEIFIEIDENSKINDSIKEYQKRKELYEKNKTLVVPVPIEPIKTNHSKKVFITSIVMLMFLIVIAYFVFLLVSHFYK